MEENKNTPEIMLPTGESLVVSSSPHLSSPDRTSHIMGKVLLALIFPAAAGIWYFGWRAAWVIFLTAVFCIAAEALWCKVAGKPVKATVLDGSAAVTGVILGLNMPPEVPFYVPLLGAILAIWIGKQVFGGLGYNPFNPAVVARVGLLIALPGIMTFSSVPRGMDQNYPNVKEFRTPVDAVTCATPLSIVSASPKIKGNDYYAQKNFEKVDNSALIKQYFLGCKGGSIGEVCIPAILLGALVLIGFNLINWRVPVCYVGTVAIITGIVNYFCPGVTPSPLFHLVTGGLMFAAVFMATDMVTCPITGTGCVIFAFGCGVITSVIRIWGNYPEGVSFAILFMNALVPLIDKWSRHRPFGYRHRKEAAK